ncbi:MAG: hypothetical protein MI742_05740 [Desulfobacterales bacterium]|nr:hypothetical protein [Desulfobacterales bacterium]
MKTHCFIGTDKNAGKTTAFNAVYTQKVQRGEAPILLTSIGINGETTDEFDGGVKPGIRVMPGSLFVTAGEHLHHHTEKYETLATFVPPFFSKPLILGRCILAFDILLEGPNTGLEMGRLKEALAPLIPEETLLLIDGSIDRQFLASPGLCDGFYFSVLFSKRAPQRKKAEAFLSALAFKGCRENQAKRIASHTDEQTRSLLYDEKGLIHKSEQMPFADKGLHKALSRLKKQKGLLYLNGALTSSLAEQLAPLSGLSLVLDNMTLYQNVSTGQGKSLRFLPEMTVLHPVSVLGIFLREEAPFDRSLLPRKLSAFNLFRGGVHDIGI